MSRKRPKGPRWDVQRGRHKKHASRETDYWNREHLIPERPGWMSQEVYEKLAKIREQG